MGIGEHILRHVDVLSLTLDSTLVDTPEIDMRDFAGGSIQLPTGSSITTLTYYGCHTKGGTHVALLDADGVAVTQTVAAVRIVDLPAAIFGLPFLKILTNADGAVTVCRKT